jgi:predicted molibdopterin-dependent oxidoreductase YjgC
MVFGSKDFYVGNRDRDSVLMNPADAEALGVREGDAVRLRSEVGEWTGRARLASMKERHLQTYWPETNVLIPRRFDPASGEPDYNTLVTAEPVASLPGMRPAPVESEIQAAPTAVVTEPAMARQAASPETA